MPMLKSGKCVYCLNWSSNLTDDHIISRKYYPNTTPSTVEKWTVPACSDCNHHYGIIEQELLIRIGLCLSSNDPKSSGILQIALNSFDPNRARDERDRNARIELRKRIRNETFTTTNTIPKGILPNFGPHDGVDYGGHYRMIKIPADLLEELGQKYVRGLTYKLENGRLITQMQTIEIYFAEDQKVIEVANLIKNTGTRVCRGEGIEIDRAVGDLGRVGALYKITIWGRLTFYAVILPKE